MHFGYSPCPPFLSPNLELHNALDESFQFQNCWQNWKSTHWVVSNLHFTTGTGQGDNNIWERGKEFETTCKAGLAASRRLIHRWVSACLADSTCILSHKGLTHSLPLFCWTSFFHYHFLASRPITPFEAGFKCQPTFCCAHSFYNLHVWKTVLEFYEYEDIITFSSWRISGTKTMPVGLISLGLFPLTLWFVFEKISRVITLPDSSVHHTDGNQ